VVPDDTDDPQAGNAGLYALERSQSSPRLSRKAGTPTGKAPASNRSNVWQSGGSFAFAGGGGYGGSYVGGGLAGETVDGGLSGGGSDGLTGSGVPNSSAVMLAYNQMGGGMPSGNTFYETMFSQPLNNRAGSLNNEAAEPDPRSPRPGDEIDWNEVLLPGPDGCYGPFFSPLSEQEEAMMLVNDEMGCGNEFDDAFLDIVDNTSPPPATPTQEDDGGSGRGDGVLRYKQGPDGCYGPFFSPMSDYERQLMAYNERMGCDGGSSSSSSSSGGWSSSSGSSSGGWSSSSGGQSSTSSSSSSSSGTRSSSTSSSSGSSGSSSSGSSGSSSSSSSSGGTVPLPGTHWLMLVALLPLGARLARSRR
jgi:hypothetical protein